jgi:hypothetical protein
MNIKPTRADKLKKGNVRADGASVLHKPKKQNGGIAVQWSNGVNQFYDPWDEIDIQVVNWKKPDYERLWK